MDGRGEDDEDMEEDTEEEALEVPYQHENESESGE
jgi:hypothetical protein